MAGLSDPANFSDLDEKDPKSMARWLRRMEGSLGEDLGEDFREMTDAVEAGENPETDHDHLEGDGDGDYGEGDEE